MGKSKRISAFLTCIVACEKCITHCIKAGNQECVRLCLDCADVCALCVRLEARNSEFARDMFALCTKVCEACAEECGKHAQNHETCKDCAVACTQCAATTCN